MLIAILGNVLMIDPLLGSARLENFALSYHNSSIMDGAGSQLQRLYSIYALSRFLGISYIHSPLQEIEYQGFAALEKNETSPELVARYNKIFTIPSDREIPAHAKIFNFAKTDLLFLRTMREELKNSNEFFLFNLVWPQPMVDTHPEMVHCVKAIAPFQKIDSPFFKIVIHVRRGDLLVAPEGERMLPNDYYLRVASQVIAILEELDISFICELHTEIPSKTFTVFPEHQGMKHRIRSGITVSHNATTIEAFEALPHLKKCINTDPIEALQSFATADLLIMSRSSFSYVGAMLNQKGIIVYHPFWNATPLEWIDATHQPSFRERVFAACLRWKARSRSLF